MAGCTWCGKDKPLEEFKVRIGSGGCRPGGEWDRLICAGCRPSCLEAVSAAIEASLNSGPARVVTSDTDMSAGRSG